MTDKKVDPVVEEIARATEDAFNVKGELEHLIQKISLAKLRKDTENANKLYEAVIRICGAREWYSSAAKAARAIGDLDMAGYYEERHEMYIRSLSEQRPYIPDPRGKWGWLDGEDEL